MSGKNTLSNEKLVYRVGNGIKLVRPEKAYQYSLSPLVHQTPYSVGSLLRLPISVYFLNHDGATQQMNEEGVSICGFESIHDALGKTLFAVTQAESANTLIHNCKHVIQMNAIKMFDEINRRKDNHILPLLSVKAPWYDDENNIIGTYGCSIALDKHPLAESLALIQNLGLLNTHLAVRPPNPFFDLSKRQMECLQYTMRGYTAKRVAQKVGLSHRTVEEYLNNIKAKTGARSKAELIEIAANYFLE